MSESEAIISGITWARESACHWSTRTGVRAKRVGNKEWRLFYPNGKKSENSYPSLNSAAKAFAAKYTETLDLIKQGHAGVNEKGTIVDMRKHADATPIPDTKSPHGGPQ